MSNEEETFQTEMKAAVSRLGFAVLKAVLELGVAIFLTVIISWIIKQAGVVGLIPQFIYRYTGSNATIQIVIFYINKPTVENPSTHSETGAIDEKNLKPS